jgi:hypothetical protein
MRTDTHTVPPQFPPHPLADWLHQAFLARKMTSAAHANLWPPVNSLSSAVHALGSPIDLVFTQHEVECGTVGAAVDRLMDLSDSPTSCARNLSRARLRLLGPNGKPVDIVGAEPSASFFQEVSTLWPYWLHFLEPSPVHIATLLNLTFTPVSVNFTEERVDAHLALSEPAMESFFNMVHATVHLHNAMGAPMHITTSLGAKWRHALCTVLV